MKDWSTNMTCLWVTMLIQWVHLSLNYFSFTFFICDLLFICISITIHSQVTSCCSSFIWYNLNSPCCTSCSLKTLSTSSHIATITYRSVKIISCIQSFLICTLKYFLFSFNISICLNICSFTAKAFTRCSFVWSNISFLSSSMSVITNWLNSMP